MGCLGVGEVLWRLKGDGVDTPTWDHTYQKLACYIFDLFAFFSTQEILKHRYKQC